MKKCELCNSVARMYCDSDQASLCWDCDARVHTANFLVAKHSRTLLCHVCQSPTPWTASGPRLGPTVSVCQGCTNTTSTSIIDANHDPGNDREDDRDDDESDRDDNEEEEEEADDSSDEDDGDNQVVPLASTPLPPPKASSSSSSEESSKRFSQRGFAVSRIGVSSKRADKNARLSYGVV